MARKWEAVVEWILAVALSPIALLGLILLALWSVLLTTSKAILLFSIVAVNTPFAVMFNMTVLAGSKIALKRSSSNYFQLDPRVNVGIEVKGIVSDFFKVIAGDLLLVLSTGVITFYTAPLLVFYISMAVGVTAILLKWLNSSCLSKTAFSCLCAGYGLNPMMFLFSFIGLFDIGCHPIAKCSFIADKAFLFTNDRNDIISYTHNVTVDKLQDPEIEYPWDAFERGWFQLRARIDYVNRDDRQHILKTSMVLKLWNHKICEYPVDRLELPEDYTQEKRSELLSFLRIVQNGFITDKMRGRYEHSLTLQEIVDGVKKDIELLICHRSACLWWLDSTDYGSMLIMSLGTLLAVLELFGVGTSPSSMICFGDVYVSTMKDILLPTAFLFLDQSIVLIYLNLRCWFHAI